MADFTGKDPILNEVAKLISTRKWPVKRPSGHLAPYWERRSELGLSDGMIVRGEKPVIPYDLRSRLLKLLHIAHSGASRMKSLARLYFWYPGMDKEIEEITSSCRSCAENGPEVVKVPLHLWEIPDRAWQRIHIDFAGPFRGSMWLIVVDAKTKWPEVIPLKETTSDKTFEALERLFAVHGIPEQLVSDNGPQFRSKVWQDLMVEHGIVHTLSPPYHPRSNGEAERFVRTFKESISKAEEGAGKVMKALNMFLMLYRATPHPATGKSPSEMMLGRRIRTPLAILWKGKTTGGDPTKSDAYRRRLKENFDKHTKVRYFEDGDFVFARNYGPGPKWFPGKVVGQPARDLYLVETVKGKWSRHANQLKIRSKWLVSEEEVQEGSRTEPVCQDAFWDADLINVPFTEEIRGEEVQPTPQVFIPSTPVESRRETPLKSDDLIIRSATVTRENTVEPSIERSAILDAPSTIVSEDVCDRDRSDVEMAEEAPPLRRSARVSKSINYYQKIPYMRKTHSRTSVHPYKRK